MRRTLLIVLGLCLCTAAVAQKKIGNGQVSGSFESQSIGYLNDKALGEAPEDHFGSNNYIKADYMLVNAANEDDLTYVTVIYDYAKYVAAVNKAGVNNNMNVSQRGANLVCNYAFDTVAERSLVVTNIVGARVASVALEGNNGEVAVERLPKGVYVYTLVENGRNIKSQKIIVR